MTRPALGRGLSALIPSEILDAPSLPGFDPGASKGALRMIRLDRIQPNPEQPRFFFAGPALEELAESIREHGVLTPLLVRRGADGGYVLIAGERRLRASGLAGLEEVPCWVREDVSSKEQLELALVENIQREDLDPIETAESYRRLCEDFGMTQEQVARRVGKDRATVANFIRLLRLPEEVRADVASGSLSMGHARALLALTNEADQRRIAREVVSRNLSVRETESMVRKATEEKGPSRAGAEAPKADVHTRAAEDRLRLRFGTKVRIVRSGRKGRIEIDFGNEDELIRLFEQLTGEQ